MQIDEVSTPTKRRPINNKPFYVPSFSSEHFFGLYSFRFWYTKAEISCVWAGLNWTIDEIDLYVCVTWLVCSTRDRKENFLFWNLVGGWSFTPLKEQIGSKELPNESILFTFCAELNGCRPINSSNRSCEQTIDSYRLYISYNFGGWQQCYCASVWEALFTSQNSLYFSCNAYFWASDDGSNGNRNVKRINGWDFWPLAVQNNLMRKRKCNCVRINCDR